MAQLGTTAGASLCHGTTGHYCWGTTHKPSACLLPPASDASVNSPNYFKDFNMLYLSPILQSVECKPIQRTALPPVYTSDNEQLDMPKFDQKYVLGTNVKENEKSAEIQSLHNIFFLSAQRKRQKVASLSVPITTASMLPLSL